MIFFRYSSLFFRTIAGLCTSKMPQLSKKSLFPSSTKYSDIKSMSAALFMFCNSFVRLSVRVHLGRSTVYDAANQPYSQVIISSTGDTGNS